MRYTFRGLLSFRWRCSGFATSGHQLETTSSLLRESRGRVWSFIALTERLRSIYGLAAYVPSYYQLVRGDNELVSGLELLP